MTFDEYAEKYLSALTSEAKRLVQMGWNGHEEFGAGHVVDGNKMVQGEVQAMGDLNLNDEDDYRNTYKRLRNQVLSTTGCKVNDEAISIILAWYGEQVSRAQGGEGVPEFEYLTSEVCDE